MFYPAVRSVFTILLITPLFVFFNKRGKLKSSKSLVIGYLVAFLLVSILLAFWPFENYFGGFDSVEQAMKYEHGKVTILDTVETDTSILVLSDKTLDMIFKKNGRYYLNINSNLTHTIGLSEKGYHVIIYKDRREKQSYVELTIFENIKLPDSITDNKGSRIEKRFVENGMVYFLGSFEYDDGTPYKIYVDGEDIDLKVFD